MKVLVDTSVWPLVLRRDQPGIAAQALELRHLSFKTTKFTWSVPSVRKYYPAFEVNLSLTNLQSKLNNSSKTVALTA
jgi:hypothetical protein